MDELSQTRAYATTLLSTFMNVQQVNACCEGEQLFEDIPLNKQLQCSKSVASSLAKKHELSKSTYESMGVRQRFHISQPYSPPKGAWSCCVSQLLLSNPRSSCTQGVIALHLAFIEVFEPARCGEEYDSGGKHT
jgi:hypothetical protein